MLEDTMALTGIKIRVVDEDDRAAYREILFQHHENTTFRDQPFSDQKFNFHFDRPSLCQMLLSLVAGVKAWTLATGSRHAFVHVTTGFELESTERLMPAAGAEIIGSGYRV